MRIRRILAAVIATAALAGLGLTGAATATAAQGAPSVVTPSECRQGGGMPDLADNLCKGGTHDGEQVD
ncbi:hypothetical protein ACFYWN_41810 [Streptomyces sp. NPDC002917]|uniref:hypothetical protein n=1 Tax=unclassified Streptomyces TaxID=2593676 RepID=UPI002E80EC36|nr:hypothetical protein [Streptomyces sp. NBC_00562]WTC77658.1 hypothetical protein OH719_07015 [Streptomyces sp. NBC_01653]WTD37845.1 hypothetical protein OHB03_39925 [Streptomyces sp. NBC_01643]WTD93203.1 hypothetical protein OG891_39850 [Streptomyces sp. NBC_01637]WUC24212.1 hypothetical protein OHA33_38380 [Streptomyces sp. NBC_00562]